jgi:penicillin-binding protein 1A
MMVLQLLRVTTRVLFLVVVLAALGGAGLAGIGLYRFSRDLPDHQQLANYVPATGSKVYDANGALMVEFETEHRIPVTIDKVPRLVIRAFLAAEDRDFYSHNGVDPSAIIRAATADLLRFHRGQRPQGASTITQQVVRHFLLNRELSVSRKVKEAMLAYRIEHTLSKDRILEIYLNEIYLGAGSYGVAAAADTYFQKPLDKLTIAEAAYLAALPKAPNNYNPLRHAAAAKARRDWVIAGMAELGWISAADAKAAAAEQFAVSMRPEPSREHVGYFAEEVRRELVARFGEKGVYEGGLTIRTSYMAGYQQMAEAAFRKGLVDYDRRHGWRGPVARHGSAAAAQAALTATAEPPGSGKWQLAAVTALDAGGAAIALKSGAAARIPGGELGWARRAAKEQRLAVGDIVLVEPLASPAAAGGKARNPQPASAARSYGLRQIPEVSGGFVAMDPKTGRVFAMVGGWSFQQSQFNRTTQAKRQPGSAFKPFVYLTALQNGFTPWSVVEDSPLEIPQGGGQPPWRPANYEGGFIGPTTLEEALIRSRNLVTARLATMVGLPAIAKTVQDFDIMDRMPLYYSMSLGAGETTLLRLTNAYAMLDNGARWLLPSVIDVVQDRSGRIVYQKGVKSCAGCFISTGPGSGSESGGPYKVAGPADASAAAVANAAFADNPVVYKPNKSDPLAAPEATGELVSIMQGVVQRGTGTAVAAVGKPIAGKTGTTNDWQDAWFIGFSPDLAAGVYVGFDEPSTLGDGETGGHVAAPIFRDFMLAALKDKPAKPFAPPPSAGAFVASANDSGDADYRRNSARESARDTAYATDASRYPDAGDGSWSSRRSRQAARYQSDYVLPPGSEQAAPSPPNWSDLPSRSARENPAPTTRDYGAYYGGPPAVEYQQPGVREWPSRQREQAARAPAPAYAAPSAAQYPPAWSAYAAPPAAAYYGYSGQPAPAYPTWGVRPYSNGGY